jgi:L-seryl-tRNA(Ser) seleniumtransferase
MTLSSRQIQPADGLRLPSVDRLLTHPAVAPLIARFGRAATLDALRGALDEARVTTRAGATPLPSAEALAGAAAAALETLFSPSLKPVFNMTGTVLHTNLGRALLPPEAARAVADVLTRASNLEFDLASGKRGERDDHVEGLIRRLTGAEAATIVNNNAAAVLLALGALAARKEVLVSRGELVEIGGAFRVPDVMAQAGCRMREVGTTNRTHLRDFAEAIGPRTVAIMKVHQSNYEIRGFTAAVAEADLAALCRERGLILMDDLGSGNLVDLSIHGLPREPTVGDALRHADVVTFSGDKLLGGVQCGIIAGRADLIAKIRKHPLKRALRVDKMTIAAMEAVLRLYLDPDRLAASLPTLRLLTRSQGEIRHLAERIAPRVAAALEGVAAVSVVDCASQIGSGALPVESLPSAALALSRSREDEAAPRRGEGRWLVALAARLRALPMPIIGRVAEGALLLDCRTLFDETSFLEQLSVVKSSI